MERVGDREEAVGLVGNCVDLLDVVVDGPADAAFCPVRLAVLLAEEDELAELLSQLGPTQASRRQGDVSPELRIGRRELGRERGSERRELRLDLPARRGQAKEEADNEALEPTIDLVPTADLQERRRPSLESGSWGGCDFV